MQDDDADDDGDAGGQMRVRRDRTVRMTTTDRDEMTAGDEGEAGDEMGDGASLCQMMRVRDKRFPGQQVMTVIAMRKMKTDRTDNDGDRTCGRRMTDNDRQRCDGRSWAVTDGGDDGWAGEMTGDRRDDR